MHIKRHRTAVIGGKLLKLIEYNQSRKKKLRIFLTGDAYAPYAPYWATPLDIVHN